MALEVTWKAPCRASGVTREVTDPSASVFNLRPTTAVQLQLWTGKSHATARYGMDLKTNAPKWPHVYGSLLKPKIQKLRNEPETPG